jgi:ribonucleoside-triphosphate reductase
MIISRRIGLSMTGIVQFLAKHDLNTLKLWSEKGYNYVKNYDKELSHQLNVPESIKITSVKPSGTVSLLAGATPGLFILYSRSSFPTLSILH